MRYTHIRITDLYILLVLFISAGSAVASETCRDTDLTLQVLGSGGPIADDARASSAYLLWQNGKSRYLIDAGGGSLLRFAEAGANVDSLDAIAISHFHADHSSELPALLKSAYFSNRTSSLLISGPSASTPFPDTMEFLNALFSAKHGAFRYLSGYLEGSGGLFKLKPLVVDIAGKSSTRIQSAEGVQLDALPVPHGPVPSLAYRFDFEGKRVVFSSDQNGSNPEFIKFSTNADILVFHMAIPEDATGPASRLHATPGKIGQIAEQANVKTLVLSHFMQRSLRELDKNIDIVKKHFKGRVIAAKDLQCFPLNL